MDCVIVYNSEKFVKNPSNPLKIEVCAVWKNTLIQERILVNFDELCKPVKKVISELPDNLRWIINRGFVRGNLNLYKKFKKSLK